MGKTEHDAREAYEQEMGPEREKYRKQKSELADRIQKAADKNPGILESLRVTLDALRLRSQGEVMKMTREHLVDSAHDAAIKLETEHAKLRDNVTKAIDELQSFEREELGIQGTPEE